ncbi:MAG: response regulator transcription factor [Thermoleophilia bacterium]
MSPVRILLVDDHPVVRAGLRLLLEADATMAIVGEAGTTEEALERAAALQPDLVLLDLGLGEGSGLDVLRSLPAVAPRARAVVLTMHSDADYLRAALKEGAVGYVLKQSADTDLLSALRRAAVGDVFVDSHMTRVLLEDLVDGGTRQGSEGAVPSSRRVEDVLSDREFQVARLIALGHTNKEIGQSLFLSVKTVETYRARVMTKLGLANRAELVRLALREGWLEE